MNEDHLEVVGEGSQHCPMGLEVHITNGHCAVAQEPKLPLDIQLLQEEQTVAGHVHDTSFNNLRTCIDKKNTEKYNHDEKY